MDLARDFVVFNWIDGNTEFVKHRRIWLYGVCCFGPLFVRTFESTTFSLSSTTGAGPFPALKNAFRVILSHIPTVVFQMSETTSPVDKLAKQMSSWFVLRGTIVKAGTGRGAYPAR